MRNKCKYEILRVIELKCQKLFGFVPDDISIEFKSLRIMGAEQEENVKTQKFNRLMTAKEKGEISTFEFREGCNKDNLLSITLDTTADAINPDDPEVAGIIAGEGTDPEASKDEEGKDVEGEVPEGKSSPQVTKAKPAKVAKEAAIAKNSAEFDREAYFVDGGDDQFDDRRQPLFDDVYKYIDTSLYRKAKEAALKSLGKPNWKFTLWYYKSNGGQLR